MFGTNILESVITEISILHTLHAAFNEYFHLLENMSSVIYFSTVDEEMNVNFVCKQNTYFLNIEMTCLC